TSYDPVGTRRNLPPSPTRRSSDLRTRTRRRRSEGGPSMKGPRAAVSAVEAAVEDIAPRWISATRRGPARGLRAGRAQVGMGRRSLLAAPALDAPPAILITIPTDAGRNGPRR